MNLIGKKMSGAQPLVKYQEDGSPEVNNFEHLIDKDLIPYYYADDIIIKGVDELSDFHLIYHDAKNNFTLRRLQTEMDRGVFQVTELLDGYVWAERESGELAVYISKEDYHNLNNQIKETQHEPRWLNITFENCAGISIPFGYVQSMLCEGKRDVFATHAMNATGHIPYYDNIYIAISGGINSDHTIYGGFGDGIWDIDDVTSITEYLYNRFDITHIDCEGDDDDTTLEYTGVAWDGEQCGLNENQHNMMDDETGDVRIFISRDKQWIEDIMLT